MLQSEWDSNVAVPILEPTLFSQARFINTIVRTMPEFAPTELRCSSLQAIMGVKRDVSFARQRILLCPFGLYAHPHGSGDLSSGVEGIVSQLKGISTRSFEWNVRFDHAALADMLRNLGLPCEPVQTHVLQISTDYDKVFAGFDSTARNLVRRARREGLVLRSSTCYEDVDTYYNIHLQLAARKGNYQFLYPKNLFHELLKLQSDVIFVVSEYENKMIGGAWFLRDGDTMLYWHSAMDLKYSSHSPMYAILDHAIRLAHQERRTFFNFGGSNGISSLEQFKRRWGAKPHYCWRFRWQNPLWDKVHRLKIRVSAYAR